MTSTDAKIRLPDDVETALRETGLPWRATSGSKHIKLYLCGNHLVGVCSRVRQRGSFRGEHNLVMAIRNKAKELTAHSARPQLKGG